MTPSGIAGSIRTTQAHIHVRDRTASCVAITAFPMLLAVLSVLGQEAVPSIEVSPQTSKQAYAPGDTVIVAVHATIPKGFH